MLSLRITITKKMESTILSEITCLFESSQDTVLYLAGNSTVGEDGTDRQYGNTNTGSPCPSATLSSENLRYPEWAPPWATAGLSVMSLGETLAKRRLA